MSDNIKVMVADSSHEKYVDTILEEVGKNVEVDIPEPMVNEEVDRLMHRFKEQMRMQGMQR